MDEFFKFCSEELPKHHMNLEIRYSEVIGWSIEIYLKNDWKENRGGLEISFRRIVSKQHRDMEICCKAAFAALKKWLPKEEAHYDKSCEAGAD